MAKQFAELISGVKMQVKRSTSDHAGEQVNRKQHARA